MPVVGVSQNCVGRACERIGCEKAACCTHTCAHTHARHGRWTGNKNEGELARRMQVCWFITGYGLPTGQRTGGRRWAAVGGGGPLITLQITQCAFMPALANSLVSDRVPKNFPSFFWPELAGQSQEMSRQSQQVATCLPRSPIWGGGEMPLFSGQATWW